jgi:hypothetical protein
MNYELLKNLIYNLFIVSNLQKIHNLFIVSNLQKIHNS